MSSYSKTVDFAAKDSLPSGNASKVVSGTEINTEFSNIETAVNSKANTASPTFTGTATIPAVDINAGNIDGTAIGASSASTALFTTVDATGVISGSTIEADGDTSAGDNAAMGYTAAEGLILTGQGSTNDVTIKNDADADVLKIPTGTTNVNVVGAVGAGTLTAGSGSITDSSGAISFGNENLSTSGTLGAGAITGTSLVIGSATVNEAALEILDGATITTAELNILDGVTSTAAEINILDGVTATASELNALDGITATVAELNILDGVTATATELNLIDGVTSTTDELNILDGVTSTAAELNILDGVTSTAAELNILDGVTSTAAELNYTDGVTSAIQTQLNTKAPLADPNFTGTLEVGTLDAASGSITDSSGAISFGNENLSTTGTLASGALDVTGEAVIDTAAGDLTIGAFGGSSVNVSSTGAYKHSSNISSGYHLFEVNSLPVAKFNNGGDVSFYEDTGTTAKLFWDASAESLGIGTSSPSTGLEVTTTNYTFSGTTYDIYGLFGDTSGGIRLGADSSNDDSVIGTTGTNDLQFVTYNGSSWGSRMTLSNTGNVGIGTSSPDAALTVVGSSIAEFRVGNIGPSNNSAIRISRNDTTVSSGNPLGYLEFGGNDSTGNADMAFAYICAIADGTHSAGSNSTALAFGVTASGSEVTAEAMRIDPSGNVLVGTTTTDRTADAGTTIANYGFIDASRTSNVAARFTRLVDTGSLVLFRQAATQVGSISVTGSATAYNTSSDYRLKEDDVPMTGATERVKALRPINFAWKADGARVDGFFAHEAQEVVPECVIGTKDAMMDEEYEVTPAVYEDVITPAVEAVEGVEAVEAVEAVDAVYDAEGELVSEAIEAVEAVEGVEAVEAQEETTESVLLTEAVMGTRSVPDMQGIDQSKLVPLLTATIQELIERIEALEAVA